MATSFGATAATPSTAPVVDSARKSTTYLPLHRRLFYSRSHSKVPKLRFSSQSTRSSSVKVRAQSNEVSVGGSSKAAVTPVKSEISPTDAKDATLASEESISEFIAQVAGLVKLVDSKDIVELELKQLDCEVLIRKKEALPQPPPSPQVTPVQSHTQPVALPSVPVPSPMPTPAPSPAPTSSTSLVPTPSPSPPTTQISKSNHPIFKCPMAGTFYRSPAPGAPPFVKVGDKVQKGQVLCIVEAMKLMNEIEADRSGTIADILIEDGKPVSVGTPLFAIQP